MRHWLPPSSGMGGPIDPGTRETMIEAGDDHGLGARAEPAKAKRGPELIGTSVDRLVGERSLAAA